MIPVYEAITPLSQSVPTTAVQAVQPGLTKTPTCTLQPPQGSAKHFPSEEIRCKDLKDILSVIAANKKLCVPARASTLAVKLAREAMFGDDVLMQCTVAGERGGYYALPVEEMKRMKIIMMQQLQTLASCEFESVWKECLDAIGQACKRAREKKKKLPQ